MYISMLLQLLGIIVAVFITETWSLGSLGGRKQKGAAEGLAAEMATRITAHEELARTVTEENAALASEVDALRKRMAEHQLKMRGRKKKLAQHAGRGGAFLSTTGSFTLSSGGNGNQR